MAKATSLLTFPWSSPTRFKLIVNMKTAKALELVIPQLLLHTRWVVLLLTGRWSVSDEKLEGQRSLPQFKAGPRNQRGSGRTQGRGTVPLRRIRPLGADCFRFLALKNPGTRSLAPSGFLSPPEAR